MKLVILLFISIFLNINIKVFSQEKIDSFTFYPQKNCIYYDHKERVISAEAYTDSVETGMFNMIVKDVADTTKFWMQKKFPELDAIKHIEIPTAFYKSVNNENIAIGNNQKPSVITFWSTRCVPCIMHLRVLGVLAREYRRVANFYAVTFESSEDVRHFLSNKENDLDLEYMKMIIDPEKELEKKLNIPWYPTYLITDKDNHIQGLSAGFGSMRKIFTMLENLTKK